jgi:hypothetical protein
MKNGYLSIFVLENLPSKNKIELGEILCENFPDYHGLMFGDWALMGEWKRDNSGMFGVRTSLTAYNRNKDSSDFESFNQMFDRDKIIWQRNNA